MPAVVFWFLESSGSEFSLSTLTYQRVRCISRDALGHLSLGAIAFLELRLPLFTQSEVQDRVGSLADINEQIAEIHKQLEKQLLQQLEAQDQLR